MNRKFLSRIWAKQKSILIQARDPEDGTVKSFASLEDAVDRGYSLPHMVNALKHGTKYKGLLWDYANK